MSQWIDLSQIDVSSKQARRVDRNKVERHRVAFERGEDVCSIDVVAHVAEEGRTRYRILGNGRHRYFGALFAGLPSIACVVHDSRVEHELASSTHTPQGSSLGLLC